MRSKFARGIADDTILMPALFRGLMHAPGGSELLRQAATYTWHRDHGTLGPYGPPDLAGDLYTAWTGPGVSFLHLEKCAGIAIVHWLSQKFHPRQINADPWRDLPSNFFCKAPAGIADDTARFALIWGHYDLPTLRRLDPGRFVFTLLREPRARLLSLYKFWRSVNPAQVDLDLSFSVALAHRLSLHDFLTCDDPMLLDLIDNLYVRRLTGRYHTGAATDPLADAPEAALAAAVLALRGLGFVGITEQLDASATGLAQTLRIAPPPPGLRANVAENNHADPSGWFRRSRRLDMTPEVEQAMDRRTVLDRQLYAGAVAAFGGTS